MSYDDQNVFAKILRGELPCTKVHETDHALAFQDIAPQAKVHVLVIPKGAYTSWDDFSANASAEEHADYVAAIGAAARRLGVDASGYRLLANHGRDSHQGCHICTFTSWPASRSAPCWKTATCRRTELLRKAGSIPRRNRCAQPQQPAPVVAAGVITCTQDRIGQ